MLWYQPLFLCVLLFTGPLVVPGLGRNYLPPGGWYIASRCDNLLRGLLPAGPNAASLVDYSPNEPPKKEAGV